MQVYGPRSLPPRQLRIFGDEMTEDRQGSLPPRQLRIVGVVADIVAQGSLPPRQLRIDIARPI